MPSGYCVGQCSSTFTFTVKDVTKHLVEQTKPWTLLLNFSSEVLLFIDSIHLSL